MIKKINNLATSLLKIVNQVLLLKINLKKLTKMNLKELFDLAKTELNDLSTLENPDFRLEQAEFIKNKNHWEIVISYLVENTNKKLDVVNILTADLKYIRLYKKLIINLEREIEGFYIYNN